MSISISVNEAMEQYLIYICELGRSPATISTYRKNLSKFFKYLSDCYNGQLYVDDITADAFERYLSVECNGNKYSSAYRFNVITAFKCFFGFCFKKGYCHTNIARQVKQIKRRVKERVYLDGEEAKKLFDAITHPVIRVAVMTMFYAGLRINEIIKLTLDDVDFYRNSITVTNDKEEHTRVIPINYKLRVALLDYTESREVKNDVGLFFATKTGSLSPSYTNLMLHQATKKTGLNKVITCHILRHSFASNLVAKGADIGQVQKLLGHTDLATTEIYLHTNMEELKKTIDLIT